jgi:hypothetical protein
MVIACEDVSMNNDPGANRRTHPGDELARSLSDDHGDCGELPARERLIAHIHAAIPQIHSYVYAANSDSK